MIWYLVAEPAGRKKHWSHQAAGIVYSGPEHPQEFGWTADFNLGHKFESYAEAQSMMGKMEVFAARNSWDTRIIDSQAFSEFQVGVIISE